MDRDPFIEVDEDNYQAWFAQSGYQTDFFVSYFDHGLSEDEIAQQPWLSYATAQKGGYAAEFQAMLTSFIGLYTDLSGGDYAHSLSAGYNAFEKIDIETIVSQYHIQDRVDFSYQLYFPKYKVRVQSAFVLTDKLLLEDASVSAEIENLITLHGLYKLESKY